MSDNTALILVLSGSLSLFGEFLRPGRILPGLAGSALVIAGLRSLEHAPPNRSAMALLGIAAVLFLVEAFWQVSIAAGLAGTAALTTGAVWLLPHQTPAFTVPACLLFGCISTFLGWEAKRARRSKWSDLKDGEPARYIAGTFSNENP